METPGNAAQLFDRAARTRTLVRDRCSYMPQALSDAIQSHYEDRVLRAEGRPLLGEYAPLLLGGLLGISDSTVAKFELPVMEIYLATLLSDDLFDRPSDGDAPMLSAAIGLLVQRGLTELLRSLPNPHAADLVDEYFARAADATIAELTKRRDPVHPYSEADINGLSEKGALLKLTARLMLLSDGRSADVDDMLTHLLVGVQLLDDVTDWEEDRDANHFSLLLTLAVTSEQSRTPRSADNAITFARLVSTGALEQTLNLARRNLQAVLGDAEIRADSAAANLLTAVVDRLRILVIETATVRTKLTGRPAAEKYSKVELLSLRGKLVVVAQES